MNENHIHDQFDRELDGLVTGHETGSGDMLASFAREIHARQGIVRLDPDQREGIWREVMANASPDAVTTGGAGPLWQPTLVEPTAHNPWVRQPATSGETPSGWRVTIAKVQTALAIAATLALLVTTVALLRDRADGANGPEQVTTQLAAVPTRLMAATQQDIHMDSGVTGTGDLAVPPGIAPETQSPGLGWPITFPTVEGTHDAAGPAALIVAGHTPASGDDWLAPITPTECVVREPRTAAERAEASARPSEMPGRAYAPFGTPSADDAEDAATTLRQYEACLLALQNADGYVSDRFNAGASDSIDDWEAQAMRGEEISEAYADHDQEDFTVVEEGAEMTPAPTMRITEGPGLYQPRHAVQLADDRIGIPTTLVYPEWFEDDGFPAFLGNITVLVKVDGMWQIDERLPFCVGDCDEFWGWMQSPGTPSTIATPGTVIGDDTVALAPLPVDEDIWRDCPADDGPFTLDTRAEVPAGSPFPTPGEYPWPGPAVPPTIPCEIGWPPMPPGFEPVPLG